MLARAVDARINLEEFQRALTQLRAELRNRTATDLEAHRLLERIWHAARMAVAAASIRSITRHRSVLMLSTTLLGRTSEQFSTSLSFPVLRTVIKEALPSLGIEQGAISLYKNGIGSPLIPLVVLQDSAECVVEERPFDAELLAPDEVFHSNKPWHSIVMPLTSLEQCYGICVCSGEAVPNTYEALRQQISASIRGIQLHRSMVMQVATREKLDQQRLSTEARMAIDIQTTMLPRTMGAPGLEFAHVMIPANESGGDYYDVINQGMSTWIAIGDVSGHGLGAGIIMLMLQSMVTSAIRSNPTGMPSKILEIVNAGIFENVRHRLTRDDYATLMLLRYERDGQLTLSGLHEPLLVYRAASNRCESVTGPGFWIGTLPELPELPADLFLQLEDGDLLVMYTDGVTEPRNEHREQFGVERLAALIESLHGLPVPEIRDRVIGAVRAWASNLDDDLSLILARYHVT